MAAVVQADPILSRGRGVVAAAPSAAEAWRHAAMAALVAQGLLWGAVSALKGSFEVAPLFVPNASAAPLPFGAALGAVTLPLWATVTLHVALLCLAAGVVYRLCRLDHTPAAASQAAWLVALSPVGVALCADLAFGVAFVAGGAALLCARVHRFGAAGVLTLVAGLAAPFAGLVWLGVAAEAVRQRAWRADALGAAVGVLVAPLAFAAWAFWAGELEVGAVTLGLASLFDRADWGRVWAQGDQRVALTTLAIAVVAASIGAVIGRRRRVRGSTVAVFVAMLCGGVLAGTPVGLYHAAALAFPLAIIVGVELAQRPAVEPAFVAGCALSSLCLYLTM